MYKKKSGDDLDDTAARIHAGILSFSAIAIDPAPAHRTRQDPGGAESEPTSSRSADHGLHGVKFDDKGPDVLASGLVIQLQDGENYVPVWPKTGQDAPMLPTRLVTHRGRGNPSPPRRSCLRSQSLKI